MSHPIESDLPRLLVVGARGFLGTFLAGKARTHYKVLCADRSRANAETDVVLDVADPASVRTAFDAVRPDAVVLLAAVSDIDRCQKDPELAFSVNLRGAESVANVCAQRGARLLFTSTGAVFDGNKQGYIETDEPTPSSVYGETKAQAEAAVQALTPSAIILRVALVLGRTSKPETNSLLDSLVRRWRADEVVSASVLEARNPIDADTLSQWILELLQDEQTSGIFHAGATESVTRYQLAQAVAERLNVSASLVKAELQPPPGRAPRGAHHFLLTGKINSSCPTQAPSWATVLEKSVKEC
jgi:dTDP-4-dehydrorhamnose reductase